MGAGPVLLLQPHLLAPEYITNLGPASPPWAHAPAHFCDRGLNLCRCLGWQKLPRSKGGESPGNPWVSPCHTHPYSLPNPCFTWKPEGFFSIPIKASSFALRAEDPGTIQFLPYPPITLPHLPSLGVSYPQGSLYKLVPTPGTLFPPFFI